MGGVVRSYTVVCMYTRYIYDVYNVYDVYDIYDVYDVCILVYEVHGRYIRGTSEVHRRSTGVV